MASRFPKNAIQNILFMLNTIIGWGLLTTLYSLEWYSRINCPAPVRFVWIVSFFCQENNRIICVFFLLWSFITRTNQVIILDLFCDTSIHYLHKDVRSLRTRLSYRIELNFYNVFHIYKIDWSICFFFLSILLCNKFPQNHLERIKWIFFRFKFQSNFIN